MVMRKYRKYHMAFRQLSIKELEKARELVDNTALMSCVGSLESAAEGSVNTYYTQFVEQIGKDWWHPRDINAAHIRLNFLDDDAASAWIVCALVLTGHPNGLGTEKERRENKARAKAT